MTATVLLGAGFSRSIDERFPSMAELTDIVISNSEISNLLKNIDLPRSVFHPDSKLGFEHWIRIMEASKNYMPDVAVFARRKYLVELIETIVLSEIRERSQALKADPKVASALLTLFKSRSTILTTNYDLILEFYLQELMDAKEIDLDSPYGLNIGLFDFAYKRSGQTYLEAGFESAKNLSPVLKLHGSCDWYSHSADFDDKFWIDVSLLNNYPHEHLAKQSRSNISEMRSISALPSSGKGGAISNLPLTRIWKDAYRRIRKGSALIVFGSSINSSDLEINSLLSEALSADVPIWVLDKEPDRILENARRLSPGSSVNPIVTTNVADLCNIVQSLSIL